MFSVDFKINGKLVAMINGINLGWISSKKCKYHYEFTELGNLTYRITPRNSTPIRGKVAHKRSAGITKLVEIILGDIHDRVSKLKDN